MQKEEILAIAQSMNAKPSRRKTVVKSFSRQDLFVPIDRMKDLILIKDAIKMGLLKGNLVVLNRKAAAGELKAIKIPGYRGWHMLIEWIEEYNNSWVRQQREKIRA